MKRRTLAHAALAALLGAAAGGVQAQAYPSKPIKLVIPFGPGSGTDTIARVLGEQLSAQMGVPVVPENKEGAGGVIGTQHGLKAPADGYTVIMVSNALTIAPQLYAQPPYDPVTDTAPIAMAASMPLSLVTSAQSQFNTVTDLLDFAKANPGKVSYATSGKGSQSQLEVEWIEQRFGVQMEDVPYKSVGQAMTDMITNQVSFYFPIFPGALQHQKTGKVKILAVGSAARSPAAPEVPTLSEALGIPGYKAGAWFGLVAPKGTPPDIVKRLSDEVLKAVEQPQIKERLAGMGAEVMPMSNTAFTAEIKQEYEKWHKVVTPLNLKTQ